MKPSETYDVIVIGGGSAGHAAAQKATSLGLRVALVESAKELGGLCILRGCMPSKILIETANRCRIVREAAAFGIESSTPAVDLEKVHARLRSLLKDFQQDREKSMTSGNYQLFRASARFIDTHTLQITEASEKTQRMTSKTFIIATGSSVEIPEIEGLRNTPFWTSDDLPQMPFLPKRIAIVGSGAIGMECAHLFEGLGSQTHVILRGERILSAHDADLAEALEKESEDRGIVFHRKTSLAKVEHDGKGFRLTFEKSYTSLEVDALLIATGRKPNTKNIGLDVLHLVHDQGRILIDSRCVTSLPHIYAAGDCASPAAVVHLAVIQGEVAADQAAKKILRAEEEPLEWNPDSIMAGWFTEPESVEIGINESKAREKGIRIRVGKQSYADQGKGMIKGSRHGFLKVITDADDVIIGAIGVGPEVVETAHVMQIAIEQKLTATEYLQLPHYHPTLAEGWLRAVENLD